MPASDVVSDTSPILNLALIDRLDLVAEQFGSVVIPHHVWEELLDGEEGVPAIERARSRGILHVEPIEESRLYVEFRRELDRGEAAAIQMAIDRNADLLLVDEREARQVARRQDVRVTGVVGVLIRAARNGTADIESSLDDLREAGFWLSDELYETAIRRTDDPGPAP